MDEPLDHPRADDPQPLTRSLRDVTQGLAPDLDLVSVSAPEPILEAGDTVAVFRSADDARALVLAWERLEAADAAVGFVAFGSAPGTDAEQTRHAVDQTGPDPEGVTGHAARRIWRGAVPGAAVGGGTVAAALLLWSAETGAVVGGTLGGAVFGGVAGATMSIVRGTGWGAAYQHTFVDPGATELVVASFHSSDAGHVDAARRAAADAPVVQIAAIGPTGELVPLGRAR